MGQDWKTLSIVVLGAATAGWFVVRAMTAAPPVHPPSVGPVAPAETSAAIEEAAAVDEAAAPERPRATVGAPASVDDGAANVDVIARDLDVLSQALVRDQRVEDRVLPRINDALDVPGVTSYRRAPDFWEPAFASSEGAHP